MLKNRLVRYAGFPGHAHDACTPFPKLCRLRVAVNIRDNCLPMVGIAKSILQRQCILCRRRQLTKQMNIPGDKFCHVCWLRALHHSQQCVCRVPEHCTSCAVLSSVVALLRVSTTHGSNDRACVCVCPNAQHTDKRQSCLASRVSY